MSRPLLLFDTPDRSADLRHAVPAQVLDAFLYAELDDRRVGVVGVMDGEHLRAAGVEVLDVGELGLERLVGAGRTRAEALMEVALRACRELGIAEAAVPPDFPVALADHLRRGGVAVEPDAERFFARRRVKTPAQLAGIRRAQAAADAATQAARALIWELPAGLTSEQVRAVAQETCREHGAVLEIGVIAGGAQSAIGHEWGSGPIAAGTPVIVDLAPRDEASGCYADMCRTFVAGGGEPPAQLRRIWELCRRALADATARVRAGAAGPDVYAAACEVFEAAGEPTLRTRVEGETLDRGFYHTLGHGVGLEVHERPHLSAAPETLRAGDVLTVEPACYVPGFGGCRLEDLVVVCDDGCELLTATSYELSPQEPGAAAGPNTVRSS